MVRKEMMAKAGKVLRPGVTANRDSGKRKVQRTVQVWKKVVMECQGWQRSDVQVSFPALFAVYWVLQFSEDAVIESNRHFVGSRHRARPQCQINSGDFFCFLSRTSGRASYKGLDDFSDCQ